MIVGKDAALRHQQHFGRHPRRQLGREAQVDLEGTEIPVIDTHQGGACGESDVELRLVVDLDEGTQPALPRPVQQRLEP